MSTIDIYLQTAFGHNWYGRYFDTYAPDWNSPC